MKWFGDILFHPPQSVARELRERGVRRGAREDEVPDRIRRMVRGDGNGHGEAMEEDAPEEEEEEEVPQTRRPNSRRSAPPVMEKAVAAPMEDEEEDEEEDGEEEELNVDTATASELMELTVSELKQLLSERGLKASGVKKDLVARLIASRDAADEDGEDDDEVADAGHSDVRIPEHSKSLSLSISANKSATDMFTLNERLHDILENEAVKDQVIAKMHAELTALRAQHAMDLDDLSFAGDLRSAEAEFHAIVEELRELQEREDKKVAVVQTNLTPLQEREEESKSANTALKKQLEAAVKKGDQLEAEIRKISKQIATAATKQSVTKAQRLVDFTRSRLLEAAMHGIRDETEKHDPQRDQILTKLDSHINKLKEQNEEQVELMHMHSRDIITEAREHLEHTYENRTKLLQQKYSALRELLKSQQVIGDDALSKHQEFVEEHYRAYIAQRTDELKAQVSSLQEDALQAQGDEQVLKEEVAVLEEEAKTNEATLSGEQDRTKDLQGRYQEFQKEVAELQDQIYQARVDLEDAERKEKKIEVDYDILMVENSNLTEEIDRFGALIHNAEKGLVAANALEPIRESPAARGFAATSPLASRGTPASSRRKGKAATSSAKKRSRTST
mmetsp:Transcript_17633/g.51579  ORF Transcript_17633/g.51579 Transcript_17633/m.51579 type:complete len:620 (-) Transcript_17633:348-2207(-)